MVINSAKVGEHVLKRLWELYDEHEFIGDVRGKGLLIGLELVENWESKEPVTKKTDILITEAYKRGLLIARIGTYKQTIRLTPPLTLTKEDGDKAVEILKDSIKTVEKNF